MRLAVVPWSRGPIDRAELRSQLQRDGCSSVFEWSDAAGAGPAHQHDHDEGIRVVCGEMTFTARGAGCCSAPATD
ncbi:MAG: hypothetical protein U0802_15795 [Candidatus Binatia bacterium]